MSLQFRIFLLGTGDVFPSQQNPVCLTWPCSHPVSQAWVSTTLQPFCLSTSAEAEPYSPGHCLSPAYGSTKTWIKSPSKATQKTRPFHSGVGRYLPLKVHKALPELCSAINEATACLLRRTNPWFSLSLSLRKAEALGHGRHTLPAMPHVQTARQLLPSAGEGRGHQPFTTFCRWFFYQVPQQRSSTFRLLLWRIWLSVKKPTALTSKILTIFFIACG